MCVLQALWVVCSIRVFVCTIITSDLKEAHICVVTKCTVVNLYVSMICKSYGLYIYVCMYVRMYVCIHIHMYVCESV